MSMYFPFGQPVLPCPPSSAAQRDVMILGAYPSALHVQWSPPEPWKPVQALAVDNEPEPFWDGHDATERFEVWRDAVADCAALEDATAVRLNG